MNRVPTAPSDPVHRSAPEIEVVADPERDPQAEFDRAAADTDEGCCDAELLCVGNNEVARALATAGFAAMWTGPAAQPSELVPDSPDAAAEVATALADRGRAELDANGRLVGIHGLTLRTTRHRIVHDGRAHWTWCAFDAIGIPAALGIDATARTDCPVCRTPITVALRHGVPEDHPAVLWLPDSSGSNLMSDFCSQADLYCSREHLEQRIDVVARLGRVVDVHEGAALGRVSWADVADVDGKRS